MNGRDLFPAFLFKVMKKGLILTNAYTQSEAELYQPRRLSQELNELGVQTVVTRNSLIDPAGYDFCVYYDKDKYCARRLEGAGFRLFNRAAAIETCDDKMLTYLALGGFPMPKTLAAPLCYTPSVPVPETFYDKLEAEFSYPLIVKECFGSLGKGVYKIDDRFALSEICERLKTKPHLFQEYVSTSYGTDVRAVVIGGKVVCAMKRSSENFKSNVASGGHGEIFALDEKAKAMCTAVASRLKLDYCGIDLLFGKDGFLICEVNSNAFFYTTERVTGVNVAKLYATHIVKEIYGEEV